MSYEGEERRTNAGLTDEQVEVLTNTIAQKLEDRVYNYVGRAAFKASGFLLVGTLAIESPRWAPLILKVMGAE